MHRLKELLFWTIILAYTGFVCALGYVAGQSVRYDHSVRLVRANDGTPCYTYRGQLACDFYQRSTDTRGGQYPYAVEEVPDE